MACAVFAIVVVGLVVSPLQHVRWQGSYGRVTSLIPRLACVADCRAAPQSTFITIVPQAIVWRAADGMAPTARLLTTVVSFGAGLATALSVCDTLTYVRSRRLAWLCVWKS